MSDGSEKLGIVGQSTKVGIRGMGGVGKSVLATALAYDEQVRSIFADGVIWITIGHKPPNRWKLVLQRLRNSELEKIKQQFTNYPYPDLFKALHISVEDLDPEIQTRYLDFAVFPQDYSVPEAVFETLWADEELLGHTPIEIIDLFIDKSLAYRGYHEAVTLHDLQFDYVRRRGGEIAQLHNRLLNAYGKQRTDGWASGPNDGYYFQYLVHHLDAARRPNEAQTAAKELLLSVRRLHPRAASRCLDRLGEEAKDVAKILIQDNTTHLTILCRCLNLLGETAKDDAKRLLKDSKSPEVLCTCLTLLGETAKDDAKRLLKESKSPEVLCTCLKLLGEAAKDDAERLLKESKDYHVLCACLDLLGDAAKDDARRLL